MVRGDRVGHVLHEHGLAGLGGRDDQAALPLADGRHDVDHAPGEVLLGLDVALELHHLVGVQRREVLEEDLRLRVLGRLAVDGVHLDEREVALAVLRRADLAFDRIAGVQVETPDLRRRDVDVVGAREVGGVGRAQETKAVGQDLQGSIPEDGNALLRLALEQREDQVLLAHPARVLDAVRGGHLDQRRAVVGLQLGEVVRNRDRPRSRRDGARGSRGGRRLGGCG